MNTDTRHALRMWLICVLLPCLLMATIGAVASVAHATPRYAGDYVQDSACFPADAWAPAPDSIRPCVRVIGLRYAGDVIFKVKDASGVVRYSGYVESGLAHISAVRVVTVYEDGSFRWQARGPHGVIVSGGVGNLQD